MNINGVTVCTHYSRTMETIGHDLHTCKSTPSQLDIYRVRNSHSQTSKLLVSFIHLLVEISATSKCLLVYFTGWIFDQYSGGHSKIFMCVTFLWLSKAGAYCRFSQNKRWIL